MSRNLHGTAGNGVMLNLRRRTSVGSSDSVGRGESNSVFRFRNYGTGVIDCIGSVSANLEFHVFPQGECLAKREVDPKEPRSV